MRQKFIRIRELQIRVSEIQLVIQYYACDPNTHGNQLSGIHLRTKTRIEDKNIILNK
jgi:hypothetical protein